MSLSLPSSNVLSRQLGKVGLAAKAAGPSLFSPLQAPGPVNPQQTSMTTDRYATSIFPKPDSLFSGSRGIQGFGQQTLIKPGFDVGGTGQNPYYNPPSSGGQGGQSAQVGGDYAGVEQWSSAIDQAASQYGIDPNLIKAVMKLESNGDPNAVGSAGVWGPMQVNSNAWGDGPWMTDPVANILKGAEILKYYLDANGGDMREALRGYHGYGYDGYTTDEQYADTVLGNMQQLGTSGGGGIGNLGSIFQNATVPDWGEFNAESDLGYYGYGADYGLSGTTHTGVDVPMAVGSAYRAPMSGTVTCGGTGNGQGADGGGCAAFGDYYGNGAGRVEVLLDDGTMLIFGHSSTSAFQPGQRFNAGDVLGTSGGMNSPHIHLEARVRDSSTPSGWRIVDPRNVSGGSIWGGQGGGSYYQNQSGGQSMDLNQKIQNFLRGYSR